MEFRRIWLLLIVLSVGVICAAQDDKFEDEEEIPFDRPGPTDEEPEIPDTPEPESFEPHDWTAPDPQGHYYFADCFKEKSGINTKWILSKAMKDGMDADIAKYNGEFEIGLPERQVLKNDFGLILKTKARHHAISSRLSTNFDFRQGNPLVVMYDVLFQNGQECGGAYIKLLSYNSQLDLKEFKDQTPYTIMFGPDKCGLTEKLHFIVRYRNPVDGTYEEKHAKQPDKASLSEYFTDKKTHLYTLALHADGKYQIHIDQKKVMEGSLLETMTPAILPQKEIEDPQDKKPSDWDDKEKIADPEAKKPDDWDEEAPEMIEDQNAVKPADWLEDELLLIPDEKAERPEDWDDEMDGKWEPKSIKNPKCEGTSGCGKWTPPKIKNPAFKGKWHAPLIANPNFKGIWKPRVIPNPNYFEDKEPFKALDPIGAVGLELWSMSEGIIFDDFLITDDKGVAETWKLSTWYAKKQAENARHSKESFFGGILAATNERPWLWAVFVLVLLIPIVLIAVFCCSGSTKESDESSRKKTDEPTADVIDDEAALNEEDKSEEMAETEKKSSSGSPSPALRRSPRKQKKADLEESEEEEEEEEEQVEPVAKAKESPSAKPKQRAKKI